MARGARTAAVTKNPAKTLAATLLLLALLAVVLPLCASQPPLHSQPLPATQSPAAPLPPPQPRVPHAQAGGAARLRRIALGVLLGSLAGFLLSLAFLYAIRVAVLHAGNTPAVARGPVSFTPQISPKSLQCALPSARPLARGPRGTYHKLDLDGDLTVAVKMLDLAAASRAEASPSPSRPASGSRSDMRRVQRQLELLARVRHLNVMSLKAYVRDADRLSLVYDFVPGGSLEDVMKRVRSQQVSLSWDTRNRIAAGVAKGLRHLHFECNPRILHCNLKPSNVMLEEGFEPVLADCGVARLIDSGSPDPESSGSLYAAPECYQSSRYTDKCDIYAFGMILGVLLTGKDPADPFFTGESGRGSLARWLRHMQHSGDTKEALDSSIVGEEVDEEEMVMAVRVAIVCLSELPADRPSSDELVAMLAQLHSF
ncbi:inactive leucine-rich repeat receptor-like protein kinase CORYNE [Hordeum vulgare subsp. vulgare]|uniref:Protein kinase domain-containing protein n=1 Tax=Hordeum vulgare subsp. vulgare TaxID=112509 RepID=A0A8I6XAZ6_HORVV|nr:inactive leucine-rich repeat receptor-like protein kinase CORYNE [Hordeum vulgare subsp. vulgare]